MNSSTSSSERAPGAAAARTSASWRGFIAAFLATAAVFVALFLTLAFLVDPYDTGRSPFAMQPGVRPQGPRTAAASRGRDPAFRAAIFGNSHIQLISPDELRRRTGIPFVSLIAPATGPKESLVLIDWFLRHRGEPAQGLVIGIDERWCRNDPALTIEKPFPFWLFSRNPAGYLANLLRYDVIEEVQRRIGFLLARAPERATPDGYWDYEASYLAQGFIDDPARRRKLAAPIDISGANLGPFPAATALGAVLEAAPAHVPVVLVRPPVYASALPAAGSIGARAYAACVAAYEAVAARHPKAAVVDWRKDLAPVRDPANFFDHTHYRHGIARLVEADIAAALARLR